MAQKNATPNREQSRVISGNGLHAAFWVVVKDFPESMIVKHRITGEFKHLRKECNYGNRKN
jgi:hypothetical protein